jgi:hypothetical protein
MADSVILGAYNRVEEMAGQGYSLSHVHACRVPRVTKLYVQGHPQWVAARWTTAGRVAVGVDFMSARLAYEAGHNDGRRAYDPSSGRVREQTGDSLRASGLSARGEAKKHGEKNGSHGYSPITTIVYHTCRRFLSVASHRTEVRVRPPGGRFHPMPPLGGTYFPGGYSLRPAR